MKIKICGMKYLDNIRAISGLKPDYLGFIFYDQSARFAIPELDADQLKELDKEIQKVGVFVNESCENILRICSNYHIGMLQLHGDESPEFCLKLKRLGFRVIKAFGMEESFNFKKLEIYSLACDFFLFDTKTTKYGGSGKKFDWNFLKAYKLNIPFFLSGGISINEMNELKDLNMKSLYAIDVNSRFETEAGIKDPEQVKILINEIRNEI